MFNMFHTIFYSIIAIGLVVLLFMRGMSMLSKVKWFCKKLGWHRKSERVITKDGKMDFECNRCDNDPTNDNIL